MNGVGERAEIKLNIEDYELLNITSITDNYKQNKK